MLENVKLNYILIFSEFVGFNKYIFNKLFCWVELHLFAVARILQQPLKEHTQIWLF